MSRLEQDLSALAFRRRADEAVAAFDVMSSEKYSLSVSLCGHSGGRIGVVCFRAADQVRVNWVAPTARLSWRRR